MDCVLKSFSFASGVPENKIISKLGHDGTEIILPELPEPFCRRGFSVYEIARVLLDYNIATTIVEKYDTIYNCKMPEPLRLNNIDRITPILDEYYTYCLTNDNHMIGVNRGKVLDVSCKYNSIENFNYDTAYFLTYIS